MSACLFHYGKGSSLVLATLGQAGTGRAVCTQLCDGWSKSALRVRLSPPERESPVLSPPPAASLSFIPSASLSPPAFTVYF